MTRKNSLQVLAGYFVFFVILFLWVSGKTESAEIKKKSLSVVKVATLYENINDGNLINRSIDKTIDILKETKTDLIFRGFWKWLPVVNTTENVPAELFDLVSDKNHTPIQISEGLRKSGHYYSELKQWVYAIKKELPDIIFVGAIPAQNLCRIEYNPVIGKVCSMEETWNMALDPQKWKITREGKPVTKEQIQGRVYNIFHYGAKEKYDWRKASAYFPDITNPDFQELLLSWAKKQIDSGADSIWIDMLHSQAARLAQITKDMNHTSVRDSIAAESKIVDEIHKYGKSIGKYIYVGSWDGPFVSAEIAGYEFPYSPPELDFVTVSPKNEEVSVKKLDNARWKKKIAIIKKKYGEIPVFAFIDWALDESQTVIFSQELSNEEQREVLKTFDESFSRMGVNFIYPVHGGCMGTGKKTAKLSFGKYRVYDALAPEFQTYETIKTLTKKKSEKH